MSLSGSDWLMLVAAGAATAGLYKFSKNARVEEARTVEQGLIVTRARAPSPKHLPVLTAPALFERTRVKSHLAKIQQQLGFTPESYARDVVPLLTAFAEFVQLLPASESHHHAQPGGLLVHLLEVTSYALHFRDAYKLPKGASPEEQMRLAARYSYAVLVAALLHDIGKPVSDVEVTLITSKGITQPWVPLGGTMDSQGGVWYSVEFPTTRDYRQHEKMALPLLQSIVPAPALAWLGEHRALMDELVQIVGGEGKTSILSEIIVKADKRSVADNLLNGPRIRFASARSVPLIERLMEGLRRLLTESHLVLNRAGATGFCDGQYLWCVSGTVADTLRDYLNRNEERLPGAAGIPDDNSRLFDTWQEYGAIVPNEAGSAIWRVQVTIGAWTQSLTVLKFPLEKLFADPAQYPQALPADAVVPTVAPSLASAKTTRNGQETMQITPTVAGAAYELPCPTSTTGVKIHSTNSESVENLGQQSDGQEVAYADATTDELGLEVAMLQDRQTLPNALAEPVLQEPEVAGQAQQAPNLHQPQQPSETFQNPNDFLDEHDTASGVAPSAPRADPPQLISGPVSPAPKLCHALEASTTDTPKKANVERFMAWIQSGIANGTLPYNEANAVVHFCAEGMLLVSPRIFRDYAEAFEARIEMPLNGIDKEPWRVLQQQFQKSGYPIKTSKAAGGTYLHRYHVAGPGGKQLIGNIVPGPQRFFDPVPPINPTVRLPPRTDAMPACAVTQSRDALASHRRV